jgi:hypothetical protein
VEVEAKRGLGMDPARPYVVTDPRAIRAAKEEYQDVKLQGNVESEFLYSTLLSTDLVPFGHLPFRTVVLPVLWKSEGYVMLTASEARKEGYLGLAEWLEKCESIWRQKRGEKAERETIYSWLDYRKKLTQQRRGRYTVVYPDVNRVMLGTVLVGDDLSAAREAESVQPNRFIAENAMYYADTEDKGEAFFLASWLNCPIIDEMLQPFRRKEQGGHPHVHKKVWEFPIPFYDASNSAHRKLASLGGDCADTAARFVAGLSTKLREGSLGRLRTMIRENLRDRISEIDSIVIEILQ